MKGGREDEVTAGNLRKEKVDIKNGNEKIEGRGEGNKEGTGSREEHTDEAEVWTDVSVYYSS